MKDARTARTALILAVLGLAGLLLALPATASAQDIRTMSTGVSKDERQMHRDYSLMLTFAERTGPYIARVNVRIDDAEGNTVVDAYSEGPWFFADLSPGDYYVVATRRNGEKSGARFTIEAGMGQEQVHLAW